MSIRGNRETCCFLPKSKTYRDTEWITERCCEEQLDSFQLIKDQAAPLPKVDP